MTTPHPSHHRRWRRNFDPFPSAGVYLVSTIQDEVHQFAIGYHRQQRKKKTLASEHEPKSLALEGANQRRHCSNISRLLSSIQDATVELAAAPSMNQPAAQKVYAYFHPADEWGKTGWFLLESRGQELADGPQKPRNFLLVLPAYPRTAIDICDERAIIKQCY